MQLKEVTQRAEPPITPVPSVPWADPSRAARVAGGGEEGGHVGGGRPCRASVWAMEFPSQELKSLSHLETERSKEVI